MPKIFIDKFQTPALITYLGVIFAVTGIYLCFIDKINYAVLCLFLSGICDLFDGTFARSFKRNIHDKQFGIQIDSLADMVSFIALPTAILLSVQHEWYDLLILVLYTACAVTRLSVFNANADTETVVGYYYGLPVTFAALFIPLAYLFSVIINIKMFPYLMPILILVMSIFFILNIKIKKP